MRLLVTGGAGYIGSICASALLDRGHEVTVLDDLSSGHRDAVPEQARFIEGRVHDASTLIDERYDGILHFAAKSLVAESVEHPELYWENNVAGSMALIDAARAQGIGRFVFSSTAATYGVPASEVITEQTPTAPINPYGATKLAVDHLLTGVAAAHGIGAVSLRYFNVGGAAGGRGERHDPETHLIPNVLRAAGSGSVSIFGDDYDTPDGTCVRDYLHVSDLADAHLRALERARAGEHDVINLGTGSGYSVREVVDTAESVTGRAIAREMRPRRPGDPPRLVTSNERARARLGWSPRRSLHDIIADAWTFQQSRET